MQSNEFTNATEFESHFDFEWDPFAFGNGVHKCSQMNSKSRFDFEWDSFAFGNRVGVHNAVK